jgi:hypothetical protein
MRNSPVLLALLATAWGCFAAAAQDAKPPQIERQVQGIAGKDIRIGVFLNRRPGCTSGPLPVIRLAEEPANGKVRIRRARVRVSNDKECLAAEFPAYVAVYRSRPEFSGKDMLSLEIKNTQGDIVEIRRIIVNVKNSGHQEL